MQWMTELLNTLAMSKPCCERPKNNVWHLVLKLCQFPDGAVCVPGLGYKKLSPLSSFSGYPSPQMWWPKNQHKSLLDRGLHGCARRVGRQRVGIFGALVVVKI